MDLILDSPMVKQAKKSSERISFGQQKNLFFPELKKRTKAYFVQQEIASTGNAALFIKAAFFIGTFIIGYVLVVFTAPPVWLALSICAYLGLAASAIGFNLMHDGSHGSFSEKKWLNVLAAYSINILGGDAVLWKNKHNIIHHTYTNIEGHDQDIAQMPVLRINALQKKYGFHHYQHIYCFLVYGLSSILWIFLLDFIKYFSGKVGNFKLADFTAKDHVIFWATKIVYFSFYLVIPSFYWGWEATIVGFLVFHFVLGITLSTVFQLAHVVGETEFTADHIDSHQIEDEWAIHQLKTTANFATKNKFITWFVGGLNFQVEHHLFPKISHVHYPALNKIVKQVCMEQNVTYHEFSSFGSALNSHLSHLKLIGRN